ncbi:hypothetical protein Taro_040633 [Colocasia esculenta]|uniref:Uncharacterized protein n=1 Tax=Colocasia esculenta TaxID=4460 RepID=A0A843WJ97_COLES|nr:hypothetical protein [Colocasia esculenta]
MLYVNLINNRYASRRSTSSRMPRFTLRSGALPSCYYYGSFNQWFTLYSGASPSPSHYGSFHQRAREILRAFRKVLGYNET